MLIVEWLTPFVWGFAIGYLWAPMYQILKTIWHEAKLAKHEWSNPNGKPD